MQSRIMSFNRKIMAFKFFMHYDSFSRTSAAGNGECSRKARVSSQYETFCNRFIVYFSVLYIYFTRSAYLLQRKQRELPYIRFPIVLRNFLKIRILTRNSDKSMPILFKLLVNNTLCLYRIFTVERAAPCT